MAKRKKSPQKKIEQFVLDGSVALAWCFSDYLELALRRGLSLATLDKALKVAAAAVGVDLFDSGE